MPPTPVRAMDKAHVLMSDGWVVRVVPLLGCLFYRVPLPDPQPTSLHAVSNTTVSTPLPRISCAKQRVSNSRSSANLAIRRGKQRWSALVSAPTSRLAKTMRARLGNVLWADFVAHANKHYKASYVGAFTQRELRCAGTLDGAP